MWERHTRYVCAYTRARDPNPENVSPNGVLPVSSFSSHASELHGIWPVTDPGPPHKPGTKPRYGD
jgi:hypothetical protein